MRLARIPALALLMALMYAVEFEGEPSAVAWAQDSPSNNGDAQFQMVLELARRGQLPISPEQLQMIAAKASQSVERSGRIAEELGVQPGQALPGAGPGDSPVSYALGKEGIPFPPVDQIVLKPPPTPLPGPTPTQAPVWSPEPYKPPSRCQRDETKREPLVNPLSLSETEILKDTLFLEKSLVPLEPEEAFGKTPFLAQYEVPYDAASLTRMRIYAVPCVPYRIRETNAARYFDTGLNALKNYDSDPKGRGKLSLVIQQKLFGDSAPKSRRGR